MATKKKTKVETKAKEASPVAQASSLPLVKQSSVDALKKFGFSEFRPGQEEIVDTVVSGRDCLVVMPTGAGKSLCFQLPAVAMGKCALVISPLIALMDDQFAKMTAVGFNVARVHSDRPAEESAEAIRDYRNGKLQFLMIAPERLAVDSFMQLLEETPPGLVAIDEAHCISHWGHEFRPQYRAMGYRLNSIRKSNFPIIALTATATKKVQQDIIDQLKLRNVKRFVRGFRRNNIAIQTMEIAEEDRFNKLLQLVKSNQSGSIIVYCHTRKSTEATAERLVKAKFPAKAYHAGLPNKVKELAQDEFISGKTKIIVATIAFGMGIDKPDVRMVVHLALPGSVEAYYQEIGRAGRDGLPSRAILMHSSKDLGFHNFMMELSYPKTNKLSQIYNYLTTTPQTYTSLLSRCGMKEKDFSQAISKLQSYKGAYSDANRRFTKGDASWHAAYTDHRGHKEDQLRQIYNYAKGKDCKMLSLLDYFADDDRKGPCGMCDSCKAAT